MDPYTFYFSGDLKNLIIQLQKVSLFTIEKDWIKRASSSIKYGCNMEGFSLHFYPSTGRFKFTRKKIKTIFRNKKNKNFSRIVENSERSQNFFAMVS